MGLLEVSLVQTSLISNMSRGAIIYDGLGHKEAPTRACKGDF